MAECLPMAEKDGKVSMFGKEPLYLRNYILNFLPRQFWKHFSFPLAGIPAPSLLYIAIFLLPMELYQTPVCSL